MNKIYTLFFLISFLGSNAQTVLLNEDFNSGNISSWTLIDGDMAAPYNDPMVNSLNNSFHLIEDYDSLTIGDSIMAANSWFDTTLSANNFLITPSISFNSTGNYLNFQAKSLDGSYPEALQIYCSEYLNKDSIVNGILVFDTIALPNIWTNFQVELGAVPLNTPIYIAFRHYSSNQYILALDNISVETNNITSKESLKTSSFNVYPNPSNGSIYIDNEGETQYFQIYNSMGQNIWAGLINHKLHLSLAKGIYLVKNEKKTFKLVIE